jgi:cytochrome c oxidase cbb3-type subunit 3
MTDQKNPEKKGIKTEIKTTGHEWDGISEYNIPAPRWWLITWIICIIWAFGYWIFYPTWPISGGNTKGRLGWTQQSQLAESQKEIDAKKAIHLEKISHSNFAQIQKDPQLMEFALNGGRAAFKENCAACHGTGAQGAKGFPNLNDDDWLWGGKIDDIYQTIRFGIRSAHDKTRSNQMPAFGLDKVLKKDEIEKVAEYVLSLSNKAPSNAEGEKIFTQNCIACHAVGGKGNRSMGAPNLSDAIWLYGDSKEDLLFTITYARNGVMPYWARRLDDNTIKQLAIYVHSLGGGE